MVRFLPHVVGLLILALLIFFQGGVSAYLMNANSPVEMQNVFAAVFDWASIQTGFLFAVYGFVAGRADGFIGAIRKTQAMEKFRRLLKGTIFAGFGLTLFSMVFLIYPLKPSPGWEYYVLSTWFAGFCWSFFLFCVVAYRFGIIINVPDQD